MHIILLNCMRVNPFRLVITHKSILAHFDQPSAGSSPLIPGETTVILSPFLAILEIWVITSFRKDSELYTKAYEGGAGLMRSRSKLRPGVAMP